MWCCRASKRLKLQHNYSPVLSSLTRDPPRSPSLISVIWINHDLNVGRRYSAHSPANAKGERTDAGVPAPALTSQCASTRAWGVARTTSSQHRLSFGRRFWLCFVGGRQHGGYVLRQE